MDPFIDGQSAFFLFLAVRDLSDLLGHQGQECSKQNFHFEKQVQNHNLMLSDEQIAYHKESFF